MVDEPDFNQVKVKIPDTVKMLPNEKQREIFDYLTELDDTNKKAYEIAVDHLGSSFDICRSNGFKEWVSKKKSK